MESGAKESRCSTTFYSFPLFIQSRAMLMSCTTMDLKANQGEKKKSLVALTWQLVKSKLTVTHILNSVESMQMCTGLHRYGMLLVYGTHQPPVHFWFKFREEKPPQCSKEEFSARFEKKDGHLAQVEVNEMLRLVSDVAAEVPPDDAVPGGIVLLIKLLKDTKRKIHTGPKC